MHRVVQHFQTAWNRSSDLVFQEPTSDGGPRVKQQGPDAAMQAACRFSCFTKLNNAVIEHANYRRHPLGMNLFRGQVDPLSQQYLVRTTPLLVMEVHTIVHTWNILDASDVAAVSMRSPLVCSPE